MRSLLGGIGMSSFSAAMTPADWLNPSAMASVALIVAAARLLHRHPPALLGDAGVEGDGALSAVASFVSEPVGYHLMWYVGFYSAYVLHAAGIVKI